MPLSVLDLQLVTTLDGRLHVAASRNGGGCHTVRRSHLYVWMFRTTAACIIRLQLAARTAGYEIVQQPRAATLLQYDTAAAATSCNLAACAQRDTNCAAAATGCNLQLVLGRAEDHKDRRVKDKLLFEVEAQNMWYSIEKSKLHSAAIRLSWFRR